MPSDITLGLLIGLAKEPAPQQVMESLTQAQVSIAAKGKSGFDLSFAVSTSSPIVTDMLRSGYFDPPTRIIITVTIRGEKIVLMDGVITTQEMVPSDEAGKSVLSIKGEDVSRLMDLIDFTGVPYFCLPREARVALIIAKYAPLYGIVPLVMPSVFIDVPNPVDEYPTQDGTDLAYIEQLAQEVGYTFFVQAGPVPGANLAYWGPMLRTQIPFLPQPDPIAIDWDGRSNVESLQFSFDGFEKTLFVVIIQVATIPVPIPVPDVNPLSPPLGQKSPQPLKISPLSGLAKYTPLQAAAIALGQAAEAANIVHGQGSLDVLRYGGILPARSLVEVQGAGITYDGQYFVESATHTIKPGSYKQSFTLTRNALIAGTGSPADLLGLCGDVRARVEFLRPVRDRPSTGGAIGRPASPWAHLAPSPLDNPGVHRPACRIRLKPSTEGDDMTQPHDDDKGTLESLGYKESFFAKERGGEVGGGKRRYYGKYRGSVFNNIDPKGQGRIIARVPDVRGLLPTTWAMPCVPFAGPLMGMYVVPPPLGAGVWVEFEQGDPNKPIWVGGFWDGVPPVPTGLPGALALLASKTPPGQPLVTIEASTGVPGGPLAGIGVTAVPLTLAPNPTPGMVTLFAGASAAAAPAATASIALSPTGISLFAPTVTVTATTAISLVAPNVAITAPSGFSVNGTALVVS